MAAVGMHSSVTIPMAGLISASAVDKKDFLQGADGWKTTGSKSAAVTLHEEDVSPENLRLPLSLSA